MSHLNYFKLLFDKSEIGVCVTTAKLDPPDHPMIIYVNPYMCNITGYSFEEMINKTPRMLQGTQTKDFNKSLMRQLLSRKIAYNGSVINYTKNKEEYYAKVNINYIKLDKEEYFIGFQEKSSKLQVLDCLNELEDFCKLLCSKLETVV